MRINPNLRKLRTTLLVFTGVLAAAFESEPAHAESRVEGNTAFALELYGQLKTGSGNLFFSPYSISTALAMTYAGARGETEKQMAHVLHFNQTQRRPHSSFGALQHQLEEAGKQKGIELTLANALWAQQGHPFLPDFLRIAQEDYQANLNQADFRRDAETVRNDINRWVATRTKDKIQNILGPDSVDPMTRLVLANAIYFKGHWATQFDQSRTSVQPFHTSDGQLVAPLMHHFDKVGYMDYGSFQAVELPYAGEQLAMVVLLPRQVGGLHRLEDKLTPAILSYSINHLRRQGVQIFLPRFKLESSFNLNRPLTELGMRIAFTPDADFSGMDGTRFLYISDVFHKAWAEVNEEGTEAAAATGVAIRAGIARPPPTPVFRADHPFIFLIRDKQSGSILFLGRLVAPSW